MKALILTIALATLATGCLKDDPNWRAPRSAVNARDERLAAERRLNGNGQYGMATGYGSTATLDSPDPECPSELLLRVHNRTDYTWSFEMNSVEVLPFGDTMYEGIPPRATVFVCMDRLGHQSIAGTAYTLRPGRGGQQPTWIPVGSFDTHMVLNQPRGANPYHTLTLHKRLFR